MYKGNIPCPGCKIDAGTRPRINRDSLCRICNNELEQGRSAKHELQQEYTYVFQHYFAYRHPELNEIVHKMLDSVHNPHTRGNGPERIKSAFGDNGKYYSIPSKYFQAIKEIMVLLEEKFNKVREDEEAIPSRVKNVIQQERDIIYNEGIEKGRDLLFQLNTGKITGSGLLEKLVYNKTVEKCENCGSMEIVRENIFRCKDCSTFYDKNGQLI